MSREKARDRVRSQQWRRSRLDTAGVRSRHEKDPTRQAFYYRPGEIVTVAGEAASVQDEVGRFANVRGTRTDDRRTDSRDDLDEVPIVIEYDDGDPVGIISSINESRRVSGSEPVRAAPHYVMGLCPPSRIGPGGDPWPARPDERGGPGPKLPGPPPKVGVVDTGLWVPMPPVVAGAVKDSGGPSHQDPVDLDRPIKQVDYPGAGHGGFIAGVITHNLGETTAAGGVEIVSRRGFVPGSKDLLTEESVAFAGNEVALDSRARIINLSLGTYADGEVIFLRDAVRQWVRDGCLVVAAAGNDGTSEPWYPAAFSVDPELAHGVVAVGALETRLADGPGTLAAPAPFSNYGPWVTAWAPGADVISFYPEEFTFPYGGPLRSDVSDPFEHGLAHWDGTSFAAPFVAAEIARFAVSHGFGDDVQGAWKALKKDSPFVMFWPTWDKRWNQFDPNNPEAGRYSDLPPRPAI